MSVSATWHSYEGPPNSKLRFVTTPVRPASADSTTKRRSGSRKIWTREESRRYDACGLAAFQPTMDKCTNTYEKRRLKRNR